jgi:5-methylcytosine-specific restriction endonuclease McrA
MSQDATTSNASTPSKPETADSPSSSERGEHEDFHETVDSPTRDAVLDRDKHQCRVCGRKGPGNGGLVALEVHHIERDPDGMDQHDLENLTTLCRSCHSWIHQQTTQQEVPVELTEADAQVLLSHDREILTVLSEIGPAMASDVADALTADLSVLAVRERLWTLAGLDNTVASRDRQIVDQDASSGEWGLTGQIPNSSRSRIPDQTQTLLRRASDERVRQALDRGVDRETIADVFGIHSRTTWIKEKRARCYDFPLDAVADAGGRPSTDAEDSDEPEDRPTNGDSEQQERLTALTTTESENAGGEAVEQSSEAGATEDVAEDPDEVHEKLQQALDALEGIENALPAD